MIKAKKSLGQNFLKSIPALRKMCEIGEVNHEDIILEIGPGKGALTAKLLEQAKKVIAVEKDQELVKLLRERFTNQIENKKLILIENDILDIDLENIHTGYGYKIIANIPYNITGAILKKFLSNKIKPERMVLLVQKEVAQRIVARGGKESILSLSVSAYGIPKYIMKVEKRFFSPSPKVDSAIISINEISNRNFKNKKGEDLFFSIIKTGFSHKRKILVKNLEILEKFPGQISQIFDKLQINPKSRAEEIKLQKWLEILKLLSTER